MPLTPSSYKKIFKSKYVQDDSDEEVVNDNGDDGDYKPSTSTSASASYPTYTPSSSISSSATYSPKKTPLLSSLYLDTHPELNYSAPTSSYNSALSSSYLDSLSKTSKPTTSSYAPSSYSRTSTSPSYSQGLSSPYLESRSLLTPERPLSKLPPLPQRATPSRRTYDEIAPFSSDNTPSRFQRAPLRNLTVVSRSVTPVHSVNRSPSPVDSVSWRSNKSITPAPRRVYPQISAGVDLDDLADKEDAPVVFDANLTFVLGCKGKLKQNLKPIPAHVEKDTASNCLTDKIQDFLKRTDHVMDEWQGMGRGKRNDNNNMSVKERALMGRSKSATNIMIKGFQLFSKANSCSRSSLGRDESEDCTEAEADEVYRGNDVNAPCMLPANS